MSAETILEARQGEVLTLTLNRPKVRNAMSVIMVEELETALKAAEADAGVRVLILRGSGGHFCAGGDIKDLAKARHATMDGPVDPIAALNARFGHLALAFARTPLPFIAVVEGAVMGGGFGLACTADVTLALQGADFRLPETSIGILPAQIAPFLVERLGYSEAKRLALSGARLNAESALAVGLVHEVCSAADVDNTLQKHVDGFLRCGPAATAATKRLLQRYVSVDEAAIDEAAREFAVAVRSEEALEGMTAFLQKRDPKWSQ